MPLNAVLATLATSLPAPLFCCGILSVFWSCSAKVDRWTGLKKTATWGYGFRHLLAGMFMPEQSVSWLLKLAQSCQLAYYYVEEIREWELLLVGPRPQGMQGSPSFHWPIECCRAESTCWGHQDWRGCSVGTYSTAAQSTASVPRTWPQTTTSSELRGQNAGWTELHSHPKDIALQARTCNHHSHISSISHECLVAWNTFTFYRATLVLPYK